MMDPLISVVVLMDPLTVREQCLFVKNRSIIDWPTGAASCHLRETVWIRKSVHT